jgi:hypothetical protein
VSHIEHPVSNVFHSLQSCKIKEMPKKIYLDCQVHILLGNTWEIPIFFALVFCAQRSPSLKKPPGEFTDEFDRLLRFVIWF